MDRVDFPYTPRRIFLLDLDHTAPTPFLPYLLALPLTPTSHPPLSSVFSVLFIELEIEHPSSKIHFPLNQFILKNFLKGTLDRLLLVSYSCCCHFRQSSDTIGSHCLQKLLLLLHQTVVMTLFYDVGPSKYLLSLHKESQNLGPFRV